MAEGEVSTSTTIFPSRMEAAAVSGRSENLNFGKGLYHLCGKMHSARLSWFMVRASTFRRLIRSLMVFNRAWSTRLLI